MIFLDGVKMITQEFLHTLFDYKVGQLYRKNIRKSGIKAGGVVGFKNNQGYLQVSIQRKKYLVHRLVFLMHHGYLPKEIDHINNLYTDNRIENLRGCTRAQNCHNQKITSRNTSGVKCVSWRKDKLLWRVTISVNGKRKNLGSFKDLELAELVAQEGRLLYHANFANHGF